MAIVSSGTNRNDTNQHNLCDHCTWTLFYRRHNSLFRYYPYLLDLSCHVRLELNFSIQRKYIFNICKFTYIQYVKFFFQHKSTSPNYFQRLWWWPVFVYFENVKPYSNLSSSSSSTSPLLSSSSGGSNNPFINAKNDETVVSVHVQRKFEWPLPWPKRFIRRKHRNESMA